MADHDRFKKLADNPSFFKSLGTEIRLLIKLLGDKRVPFWTKLIPLGTLIYFFVPEPIPFVDDVVVMSVGIYAFLELCPEDVVEEHRLNLYNKKMGHAEDVVINEVATDVEHAQLSENILDIDAINSGEENENHL
jgi:uncharacterized membrane protein YkvA (DUF1232 family)